MLNYDRQITISAAGSRNAMNWPAQKLMWSELVSKLQTPVRGTESYAEYMQLTKSKQDELKDVGGFVAGTLSGNRRKAANVTSRDVITLDLDNIPAGGTQDALRRVDGLGCSYAVYSTRKHSDAKPRLRILLPLDRTVSADEYEPLTRKMGAIIGIELCDPTTFQPSRLMYWPSCSADGQYIYQHGDKQFLYADGVLGMYTDWRNVSEWPTVPGAHQAHARLAQKQGDPLTKPGVVGAFCRCYDIYGAIETFLQGIYEPCDDGRYTYTGGSTVGGAVIYDNGSFLFSHHATDPTGGKLCNSFDLVRLHKFADLDDDAKPETPANKMPSYLAMCEFALSDSNVSTLLNKERYEQATAEFNQPLEDNSLDDDIDWAKKLKLHPKTGIPNGTIDNILIILNNDPLLKRKIAFDEFANRGLVLGQLPWNLTKERREWTDTDDAGLRHYLEKVYCITSKANALDALTLCAKQNAINDVRDYLASLRWDGIKRLDTLLIDYMGAEDSEYTRAVTRKALTAAVARAMTPGVKFDYVLILVGPQGVGKTTLLKMLGRQWYSDSLISFEGKEAAELIQGTWINELGELSSLNRSETNIAKQFLSRTDDIYREPFGRRTGKHPRRCIFIGTSNESEFLRDPTGGRRFWPVTLYEVQPTKQVHVDLVGEVDQIWAEAYVKWQFGETLYLPGEIEAVARVEQERYRETNTKEGIIKEFVERDVPADWGKRSLAERRMYWSNDFGKGNVETVPRDRICAAEVFCEALNGDVKYMKMSDSKEISAVLAIIPGWQRCKSTFRAGPYGVQKGFTRG